MTSVELKAFEAALELTVKFIEQGKLTSEFSGNYSDDTMAIAMAGQANSFFNLVHSNLKTQIK